MPIVRNKAKAVLFALCLCLTSLCNAIGFGDLKVYSYLNEPLVAEISLTNFKDMDPGLMKATLADAKDFVRAGIDRPYFLTYLVFEILKYENQLLIVARTTKPVQVPYLEFLVELSWPDGNLIKDYTVLLDPPPPNLTKETRPQSLSQVAAQARSKGFGPDAIQAQLDKQKAEQQRAAAAADLGDVVKLSPNSFSDNTFDSELPQKDTPLVPSEVPDIDESEQAAMEAKVAQQAAQAAQAATEAAYQKQLATFKQQEQANAAAVSKQKPPTILGRVVDKLEDFDADVEFEPAAEPAAVVTPATPTSESIAPAAAAKHIEDPIDFQHVLPPVPPATPVVQNTNPVPVNAVAPPAFQPPTDKPAPETSNHLYLGIILSLLLIAAGIAIAVKRMHHTKMSPAPDVAADSESEFEEFSMHDDNLPSAVMHEVPLDESEEIELVSPVDTPLASYDETNKFDREFNKIDLSELATPVMEDDPIIPEAPITPVVPIAAEAPAMLVPPTSSPTSPGLVDLDHPLHVDAEEPIVIEPPTMFKTSGLTLEPEGATLIKPLTSVIDNSEAVQIKLDLAKEYLDTGDRESAKELLQEIIEIANDSQRLEAQMLLSGIV